MIDLNRLLERVKKATGPDRELDEAIYEVATIVLANGHPEAVFNEGYGTMVAITTSGWPWSPTDEEPDPGSWHGVSFAPLFSGSIDAAIALCERVTPDLAISMKRIGDGSGRIQVNDAWLSESGDELIPDSSPAEPRPPALAILAVFIHALISKASNDQ